MIRALRAVPLLLSFAVLHACAQTVTLFGLSASIPPSQTPTIVEPLSIESIVPVGTNADGATTYVEVIVITSNLAIFPSQTLTVITEPTTITETFVEDASGRTGGVPLLPGTSKLPESCGFGTDGRGTCVISLGIANATATISGDVVPIYTFTEPPSSTASQTGAASQSTSSQNGAMSHCTLAVWNVLAVVAVVLVDAL
ncbi:hypothetical protein K438DRAFT_2000260 [Mycena galopus ATCC 62051]|nr:hypothetical protein K438DRAFT_2000260 [Mycena galopus ATCC 62051]